MNASVSPASDRVRRMAAVLLATGFVALAAAPAHAFRMIQNHSVGRVSNGKAVPCDDPGGFVHWTIRSIPWYLNPSGKGSGKSVALSSAMHSWSGVVGSPYLPHYAGTTAAGFVTDGRNTINWGTGLGCSGSCLALTALVLQPGQVIVESDITFNASHTWTTTGSQYDTQAVATHELGHSLGIHHANVSSSPLPTMYPFYFGSGARTLEADDRAALQCAAAQY